MSFQIIFYFDCGSNFEDLKRNNQHQQNMSAYIHSNSVKNRFKNKTKVEFLNLLYNLANNRPIQTVTSR